MSEQERNPTIAEIEQLIADYGSKHVHLRPNGDVIVDDLTGHHHRRNTLDAATGGTDMSDKRYGDFEMVNGATLNDALDRIKELSSRLSTLGDSSLLVREIVAFFDVL